MKPASEMRKDTMRHYDLNPICEEIEREIQKQANEGKSVAFARVKTAICPEIVGILKDAGYKVEWEEIFGVWVSTLRIEW